MGARALNGVRALAIAAALVACTAPPAAARPEPSPVASGGTLRVGISADVPALQPWSAADPSSLLVAQQIFEGLVEYEPGGLRVQPKLASAWEMSTDARTWTFTLRDGVRFHDGAPFDAAAVAASFERARVDGAAAYAELWGAEPVIAKVEARSSRTVAFTLRSPFGPFLANLALTASGVVSPAAPRAGDAAIVGTGPFLLSAGAWEHGKWITLSRNDAYWDAPRKASVDRVTFRPVPDPASRAAELRAGSLEIATDLTGAAAASVRADPNLQLVIRPTPSLAYLAFDQRTRPFDDPAVRRAVAMALNKRPLSQTAYAGEAVVAAQLLPPSMLGFDQSLPELARYDEAAARKAIADAGVGSGVVTDLWYPPASATYPEPRRVAEALASDLAKVGVRAEPRPAAAATFRSDARAGRFALWLDAVVARSGDPDSLLAALFAPGDWPNPQATELLRRARYEWDPSKRGELYKQVAKMAQTDMVRVPLFHVGSSIGLSRRVAGLGGQPVGAEALAAVRFVP
ncbi:MAG: hypothetical protein FJ034_04755 [Chloroflexi bacterium]|nr:hypothetical protein [Chloroflexota bacterium]